MAETHEGTTHILRKGFRTRAAAEDHPVIAKHWRRVWVEPHDDPPKDADPSAPFPWTVLWINGHGYVQDAKGRKIASLLGPQARRETVAGILCDLTAVAPAE